MKAIILLVCRSRFHIPRVGGFIHSAQFSEFTHPYQPFVFQGKALDMDEFNTAASRLIDVRNQHLGYEVSVRLIPDDALTAEDEFKITPEPTTEVVAPTPSPEPENEPFDDSNTDIQHEFTIDGTRIMLGNERVAGLFGDDKHLRVTAAFSDLRPAIEAWLETQ